MWCWVTVNKGWLLTCFRRHRTKPPRLGLSREQTTGWWWGQSLRVASALKSIVREQHGIEVSVMGSNDSMTRLFPSIVF